MQCLKYNDKLYKYKITMGDIEAYMSLSKPEQKDWETILGLPIGCGVQFPAGLLPLDDYRKMCADCGLTAHYYDLEPQQIIDAYLGHKRLMYNFGNLIIIAVRKAYDNNAEPFMSSEKQSNRQDTLDLFKEETTYGSIN